MDGEGKVVCVSEGKVVCVTGASGYIASWIVKVLLLRGYTVKATVRDPKDPKKTEHLLALDGAKERLKLFKANLLEECSFEEAIKDCDAVFHTASPVAFTPKDPQAELIEPALKGTLNVLKTCKNTPTVKRVILTSSTAAVLFRLPPLGPNDVVDETFFSDPSLCMETKNWYPLAKILAENAAWKFAKDNEIDMVVINPGFIIGPLLQPILNFSVEIIVDIINGKIPFNSNYFRFVDVRDVALAHIKALETPLANGRYLMDGPFMSVTEIRKILRDLFPDLSIIDKDGEISDLPEMTYSVCIDKVKNLGVEFTPMESYMDGEGKVVCVTGASGYIASWIVKILLLRGYTVKATVRDPNDQKKTEHLLALEGAKERLKLFKANLVEEGSFDLAIDGCDAVIHTASPVSLIVTDPEAEMLDPAIKGTMNVLKSCAKVSSVKRVVVTSSMAAVIIREAPFGLNEIVDESFFSDTSYCKEIKNWYALAKTLAEKSAWEFAKENNMDLVVINPGLVIGPILNTNLNFSVNVVLDFVKGKNPFNKKQYRLVDVRDVALAHIKATETTTANGRYIIDGPLFVTIEDTANVVREFFPDVAIADYKSEVSDVWVDYEVCVDKVKSLGIEFIPTETSLRDTVLSLKENGLV
ncbi:unnamed protein product [Cochlearia groenlandica]